MHCHTHDVGGHGERVTLCSPLPFMFSVRLIRDHGNFYLYLVFFFNNIDEFIWSNIVVSC